MKRTIFYKSFILFLFASTCCLAQSNRQKADFLFKNEQYYNSLEYYQKVYQKDSTNADVNSKIAQVYYKIKDYPQAEKWYRKVPTQQLGSEPQRLFEYGEVLRINGKYRDASTAYRDYLTKVPNEIKASKLAAYSDSIAFYSNTKKKDNKSRATLISPANSAYADFAPFPIKNQLLYLTDRLKKIDKDAPKSAQQQVNVYGRTGKAYSYLIAQPFSLDSLITLEPALKAKFSKQEGNFKIAAPDTSFLPILRKELNVGPLCFNAKMDTLFFSRVRVLGKSKNDKSDEPKIDANKVSFNELCYIVKENNKWSDIKIFPYNDYLSYSMMHPALSPDGKRLYFASDRKGSIGGFDIFYCERVQKDVWSTPVNAGSTINTEGFELFPYIDSDNTIYFSSDGHIGLGGLDIFYTSLNGDPDKAHPALSHISDPINSSGDDFGIFMFSPVTKREKWGLLSSNRPGGKGFDDIYSFYLNESTSCPAPITVVDKETQKPIVNARLLFQQTPKDSVVEKFTDDQGKVTLEVKDCNSGSMIISKAGYTGLKDSLLIKGGDQAVYKYELAAIKGYSVEGIVTDKESKQPIDSVTVKIIDVATKNTQPLTTDKAGKYRYDLKDSTNYLVLAQKKGYFVKRNVSVNTIGRAPGTVFSVNFELEKIVFNKEIKIENIYYDLGKATLRQQSLPELDKVYDLLIDNPDLMVELSSHTDSRGKDKANLLLSQRRAASAVKYLVGKGIVSTRLIARGYGETKLINNCANGVPCSEAEHEMNRRTEFKVLGYVKNLPAKKAVVKRGKSKAKGKKR
jgi:outer membrane protein OmpA-like peptidoglycan-associated protein